MGKRKQIPRIKVFEGSEYRKLRSFRKKKSYEKAVEKYKGFGFSVRLFQRKEKGRRYLYIS